MTGYETGKPDLGGLVPSLGSAKMLGVLLSMSESSIYIHSNNYLTNNQYDTNL
jgi:hypothetical protein